MPLTRSRHKVGRGYIGRYPPDIWIVVEEAWERGITVSSDFARAHAPIVALAASIGWISSVTLDGKKFTRRWNVTVEGANALNHRKELGK